MGNEEPTVAPPPVPRNSDVKVWEWQFGGSLDDVSAVRHQLTRVLDRHDWDAADVQVVELLVSELATNAVIHAQTPFAVTAWVDGVASVAVTDGRSGDHPEIADRQPALGGMGLKLVASLAHRWGVHVGDDRKSIWFEFDPEQ